MARRLFIGLELPERDRRALAALDPAIRGLRWQSADQLHLTLCFLGPVEAPEEDLFREKLDGIRLPPFFLPISGIGTFGGQRPRTVWTGVGKGHPHLFALHKRIQDAALAARLEPDLRPFHPHITLGRARALSIQALRPFLREHAEAEFGAWKVSGFALFSSVPGDEGSVYRVQVRFLLLSSEK